MSRSDLINELVELSDMSKKSAAESVDMVLQAIINTLTKQGKVNIIGFGSFTVSERKEKKGRNPQTGNEITIPASKVVRFKPGLKLKNSVNNEK